MEIIELLVKGRTARGSQKARAMRREGQIPAVLYGHGMEPVSLQVNNRDLYRVLHTKAGENVVINLKAEGITLKESTCRIREIQHHPVREDIEHVDFTVISLSEKIEVEVPLIVLNAEESVGIKQGGVLDVVHHELEVECLPTAIPEHIEVDVKALDINDVIHVRDLKAPEGVSFLLDDDDVVVAVHPPRVVEEEAPEEGEEAKQPEVIEKGKKPEDEEGEEKA